MANTTVLLVPFQSGDTWATMATAGQVAPGPLTVLVLAWWPCPGRTAFATAPWLTWAILHPPSGEVRVYLGEAPLPGLIAVWPRDAQPLLCYEQVPRWLPPPDHLAAANAALATVTAPWIILPTHPD